MTRAVVAALLASVMLVPAPALAGHLPGPIARQDHDGGHTLNLLIEDAEGGEYRYIDVNVTQTKSTLADLLRNAGGPASTVADQLEQTPSPVREAGVFTHNWTRRGSPMLTVGLYTVDRNQGLVRAPLVIFENVTDRDHLAEEAVNLTLDEGPDMVTPATGFVLEAALVTMVDQFESYPATEKVDSYEDQPTLYAWVVRRHDVDHTVWQGLYLKRQGHHGGSNQGDGTYDAARRMELGTATRVDGSTHHAAGVYLESEVARTGSGDRQASSWNLTVGAAGDSAGSVPAASIRAEDVRADENENLTGTPEEQRTRVTLGVWAGERFMPLIGAQTTAQHDRFPCPEQPAQQPDPREECIEQTRITSLGTFVDGEYTPVTGIRYHGERFPLAAWPSVWMSGGGPGAQNAGDMEIELGTFLNGTFQPLAGAHYDDSFEHARHTFQALISAGPYGPNGYQPLVGSTYDGGLPLGPTLDAFTQDDRSRAQPFTVSAGTFLGASYAPLVGARYHPAAEHSDREHQHQFSAGAFLADYRLYVPLAGATWDGESGPVQWSIAWAEDGSLGAGVGDWEASAGTFLLASYHPIVGVRSHDDYDGVGIDRSAEQRLQVGVYGPNHGFRPLVGVTYSGQAPLVDALNNPYQVRDDDRFRVTAGVYVDGDFVPVLGVTHDGNDTRATVAPDRY